MNSLPSVVGQRLLRFEKAALLPGRAVLHTIPVALCVGLGAVTGQASIGFIASVGALLIGFVDPRESFPQRGLMMVTGAAVMTPVVAVGGLVSGSDVWHLVAAPIVALACGLTAVWGPRLGQASALALALFATFAGTATAPANAFEYLGAFLAGGLIQIVVSLAPWPLGFTGESYAPVADAWRAVGRAAQPGGKPLTAAAVHQATREAIQRTAQLPTNSLHRAETVQLAACAEEVRRGMMLVHHPWGDAVRADPERGASAARGELPAEYVAAVAHACVLIARAITVRPYVRRAHAAVLATRDVGADLPNSSTDRGTVERALVAADGALASLHRPTSGTLHREPLPSGPLFTKPLALTWASPVLQQAIRLAVTFTFATALSLILDLPHGYWIAFSVALLTQPGFAGSLTKTAARSAGTLAGLPVCAALLLLVPTGDWQLAVILTAASFAIFCFGTVNYAIAVVFITVYSVYPVELLGGQDGEPFFSRAVGTLIGGAIVVAGASVFPRRAGPRLAAALARLADDLRDLLTRLTVGTDPAELRTDVIDFRLHRAEAEATLDEAWAEPGRHGLDPRIGQKVLQELNIVGLYVADLLDGLSQPHPVLVEATMAGLSDVAGQLRTVSPTGEVTAPANPISPPPGPPDSPGQLSASLALTALASCQQALDQARRHATSGTVG